MAFLHNSPVLPYCHISYQIKIFCPSHVQSCFYSHCLHWIELHYFTINHQTLGITFSPNWLMLLIKWHLYKLLLQFSPKDILFSSTLATWKHSFLSCIWTHYSAGSDQKYLSREGCVPCRLRSWEARGRASLFSSALKSRWTRCEIKKNALARISQCLCEGEPLHWPHLDMQHERQVSFYYMNPSKSGSLCRWIPLPVLTNRLTEVSNFVCDLQVIRDVPSSNQLNRFPFQSS